MQDMWVSALCTLGEDVHTYMHARIYSLSLLSLSTNKERDNKLPRTRGIM